MSGPNTTIWTPQSGNGEYSLSSSVNLIDSSSNQLVDASGNSLISGDSSFTDIAQTAWSVNDTA